MRRELLLDFRRNGATILSMSVVADTCGALKLFVNVATIRSDAFWFSAMPYFHGDNTGSNPVGDAN
jgi:hypothetical protein